jgi:putative oxidoreductase
MKNNTDILLPGAVPPLACCSFLGLAEDRRLCGRGRLHGQPGLPLANILLVGVIALEGRRPAADHGLAGALGGPGAGAVPGPDDGDLPRLLERGRGPLPGPADEFPENLSIFGGMLLLVERGFGKASRLQKPDPPALRDWHSSLQTQPGEIVSLLFGMMTGRAGTGGQARLYF